MTLSLYPLSLSWSACPPWQLFALKRQQEQASIEEQIMEEVRRGGERDANLAGSVKEVREMMQLTRA